MREYEEVTSVTYKMSKLICDVCNVDYTDDPLEAQEFLSWINHAGYGSVFGDGNTITLDLCQHCVYDKLGPFLKFPNLNA